MYISSKYITDCDFSRWEMCYCSVKKKLELLFFLTDASSLASDDVRFLETFVVLEGWKGIAAFTRMNVFGIPHNSD